MTAYFEDPVKRIIGIFKIKGCLSHLSLPVRTPGAGKMKYLKKIRSVATLSFNYDHVRCQQGT